MYGFANGFTSVSGVNGIYPFWLNLTGMPNAELVTLTSVAQATLQSPELDSSGNNTQNWLVDCFPLIDSSANPWLEFDFAGDPVNGPGGINTMVVSWTIVASDGGTANSVATSEPSALIPAVPTDFVVDSVTVDGAITSWTAVDGYSYIVKVYNSLSILMLTEYVGQVGTYTITGLLPDSYTTTLQSYISTGVSPSPPTSPESFTVA
jgi:hypothetical protein